MSKPVVFVIGASGNVGSATIQALAAKYASRVEIRAGVRNPDKADKLKSIPNVSVVKAEMGTAELENTLKGVHSLFIVTPGVINRAPCTYDYNSRVCKESRSQLRSLSPQLQPTRKVQF